LLFRDNGQGRRGLALKEGHSHGRNRQQNDARDNAARPIGKASLFLGRQDDVDAWTHAKFWKRKVRPG
jgi:hypothetical protein